MSCKKILIYKYRRILFLFVKLLKFSYFKSVRSYRSPIDVKVGIRPKTLRNVVTIVQEEQR